MNFYDCDRLFWCFFSCICKNQQTQKFIEILFDSFIIIILAVCSFCMSDGMVAHELYSVFASVEAVEPFVRLMMNIIDSVIACISTPNNATM